MVARPSSCPRRGVYVRLVARRFRLSEATAGRRRRHRRDNGLGAGPEASEGSPRWPQSSSSITSCSSTTPYELRERGNDTRGKRTMGVTVQGEHDGLEEDSSDPERLGARGPARPT